LALQLAGIFASYTDRRGLIFADTKFEFFGQKLIDEFGTPDSSRFWDKTAWRIAQRNGKLPLSLDKQFLREWAKTLSIHKRKPEVAEDVAFVHEQVVPEDVRKMTSLLYRYIFWRLTGIKLETFQSFRMGIKVDEQKPRVEILIGSESDRSQVEGAASDALKDNANYRISVMSCHRNPDALRAFAENELVKADRVISCAGKAAAKPGIVKAWLCHFKRPDIPVIGVALKGQTPEDDRDAVGSITGLPGRPVELDENGDAYFGEEGVQSACIAASKNEFLPRAMAEKPVSVGDWKS
jgi:phosphoribosylcarboxyaminoimidazole (NCAIR) mutase